LASGDLLNSNYDPTCRQLFSIPQNETEAQLQPETSRDSYFLYLDHKFGDDLTVYGQVLYGKGSFINKSSGGYLFGARQFTIFSGNPFLPANIQQMMIGTGTAAAPQIPSVTLGRIGHSSDIAFDPFTEQDTETTSVTGGFDWDVSSDGFFDGWAVNGYYQNGTTDVDAIQRGGIRLDRIYLAADAVRDANGNIVCNVARTSGQHPDCQPLNMFGRGQASTAAVDWVTRFDPGIPVSVNGWLPGGGTLPYSYVGNENKLRAIELDQDVFELSANGQIAKGWAGPIAMAAGVAYRSEGFVQYVQAPQGNPTADPSVRPVQANSVPLGIRGVPVPDSSNSVEFQFSKVPFGIGDFDVKEAYTELRLPLIADRKAAKRMDLDLAYRWARYSGSGDVGSWKAGLEYAINDGIRLRSTVSEDVRAATLGERYDRTGGVANIADSLEDPAKGTASRYDVTIVQGGNPEVKPEDAKTKTVGIVFTPRFADSWHVAVDWYDITIKDNINQFGVQNVIDNCYLRNDVDSCSQIDRNAPPPTGSTQNRISLVNDVFINVNSASANGVDFEVSYGHPVNWFGGSTVNVRLLGSFLDENSRTDSAGTKTLLEGTFGLPDWQGQLSGNLNHGPLSLALQVRYSADVLQNSLQNVYQTSLGRVRYDVLDNTIDASTLTDLMFGYNFNLRSGNRMRLYANINNLFDKNPEASYVVLAGLSSAATNGYVGDLRGRRYALGFNFDF